ncbi:MAG TPA: response regulator, partial [Steroidobacteraceae bacterium]|nr:response regulator [Steroidobacteraceae bacterium]
DLAANGLEALQMLARAPYDAVLMDVQMPEMDGLEAARAICTRWPQGERPRIIAMTANAMQGDREACLAAGMDDYLSKPIRVEELAAALRRTTTGFGGRRSGVGGRADDGMAGERRAVRDRADPRPLPEGEGITASSDSGTGHDAEPREPSLAEGPTPDTRPPTPAGQGPTPDTRPPTPAAGPTPALDAAAVERLRAMTAKGPPGALSALVRTFLTNAPALVAQMEQALQSDRSDLLQRAAHTLKSNAASFGATALAESCRALESQARDGNLAGAAERIAAAREQLAAMEPALRALG